MPHEHWRRWPEIWTHVVEAVRAKGGDASDVELHLPATHDEIVAVEVNLARRLPIGVRRVFSSFSSSASFTWSLAGERPPPPLDTLVAGGIRFALDQLGLDNRGRLCFAGLVLGDGDDPAVLDDHGTRLGDTLMDYVDRWTLVACASDIAPFRTRIAPLDPFSDEAILWRRWLGLRVLS
jgi:hypothetical protein